MARRSVVKGLIIQTQSPSSDILCVLYAGIVTNTNAINKMTPLHHIQYVDHGDLIICFGALEFPKTVDWQRVQI